MATKNIVGTHADGEYLHGCELDNLHRAASRFGVIGHSISATVTEVDLDIVLPAFDYVAPDGSGGFVRVSYAGGTLTGSANASGNPRNDLCVGDASGNVTLRDGTPTAETGDVEDAPMVSLASDEIVLFKVRRESGSTAIRSTDISPRAIDVSEAWPSKGADIASASALALPDTGTYFDVTGTTTIATIESRPAGTILTLQFDGILTLAHSADLILQDAADYKTAAGDVMQFISEGSGDWRELSRIRRVSAGPAHLIPDFVSSTTTTALSTNTTARVTRVQLARPKLASTFSMEVTTVGASGTLAFGVFSEDGQTRHINGVTGTISGTGLDTTDITDVPLAPGVYYVMVVSQDSANLTCRTSNNIGPNVAAPSGARETSGTLTVTAGTIPATFNPDTDVTYNAAGAPLVRLD